MILTNPATGCRSIPVHCLPINLLEFPQCSSARFSQRKGPVVDVKIDVSQQDIIIQFLCIFSHCLERLVAVVLRVFDRAANVSGYLVQQINSKSFSAKYFKESKQRHQIVVEFLKWLGVDQETAQIDSEGIEHHVSKKTLAAMKRKLSEK